MSCDRPYQDMGASQDSSDAFLLMEKTAA